VTDCERYRAALVAIAHPGRHAWNAEACRDIALEALAPTGDPDAFDPTFIGAFGQPIPKQG
jgi:hypothetical protein